MVVSIAAILDACSIYLMTFFQRESPITNYVHVLLYPLQVYKVKLWRVQMKNSACVSCAHLLKSPSTAEQSLFCKLVASQ